ncbi:ribonuclease kappa isoform X2 [Lampetra planeri]
MPSLLCCGPKLAACGIVLSIWGIVMLVLLGVFFNVHSAILLDDVPYDVADIEKDQLGPVHAACEQVSYNSITITTTATLSLSPLRVPPH